MKENRRSTSIESLRIYCIFSKSYQMLSSHYIKFIKLGTCFYLKFFSYKIKWIKLFVLEYCTFKYIGKNEKKMKLNTKYFLYVQFNFTVNAGYYLRQRWYRSRIWIVGSQTCNICLYVVIWKSIINDNFLSLIAISRNSKCRGQWITH